MIEFDSFIYLREIHVYREYRNKGIGNKLLEFFINKIVKNEPCLLFKSAIHVFTKDVKFYNTVVLPKFYDKFGFKLIDSEQNYYLRYEK